MEQGERLPGWLGPVSWVAGLVVAVWLCAVVSNNLLAHEPDNVAAGEGVPVAAAAPLAAASPTPIFLAPTQTPQPTAPLADATTLAVLAALAAGPESVPTALPTNTEVPPPTATPSPSATPDPTDTPLPTDTPPPPANDGAINALTGLEVDPAALARPPLAIMIDNHPAAAPQTGLNSADLVFEALAEGGITRFMAVFATHDPGTVGPVRSARPYFLEWARPWHAVYVHCGGSWEAIDLLQEWATLTDVDCFNGAMPFWRSDDRELPHNLYTSSSDLWALAAQRGLAAPAPLPGFLHGMEMPPDARPAGGSVGFTFSAESRSDVQWLYDPANNDYQRQQWGAWHRDAATGEIITARNVAIIFTHVWELPGDEKGRLGTDTIGRNTALLASNGHFEWGYWTRADLDSPITFLDGNEAPFRFAPGSLWIEALGIGHTLQLDQP